jgi:hypothetical protein
VYLCSLKGTTFSYTKAGAQGTRSEVKTLKIVNSGGKGAAVKLDVLHENLVLEKFSADPV